MQNTLYESGFSVQIYITNNTLDREKGILKDLLKRDDACHQIVEPTGSVIRHQAKQEEIDSPNQKERDCR